MTSYTPEMCTSVLLLDPFPLYVREKENSIPVFIFNLCRGHRSLSATKELMGSTSDQEPALDQIHTRDFRTL